MTRKRLDELGSLQRAVMDIVWDRGEASVHDVRKALAGEREPAYTTVLSVLQKLEKAGWVKHRREGRTYMYGPRRSRVQEGVSSLRGFVNRVFEGDSMRMFQHLIDDEQLDASGLEQLQNMIQRKQAEQHDD